LGLIALDIDAVRETSWAAVVIAGGAAVTLFHLTLPTISAVLTPVFDAAGGLVEVTLFAYLTFVVVTVLHFVFNLGWPAIFFRMQEIGWRLVVIGILWLLIVATVRAFDRVDRRATLLLVPYLLWVSFAAYLDSRFWVLNYPTIPCVAGAVPTS
jgi:tryptophan-rich sensory protein